MLHYAAGLPDAGYIYSMLTNAGAKEDAVDLVRKKLKVFHCLQCLCMVGVCTYIERGSVRGSHFKFKSYCGISEFSVFRLL